MEFSREMKKEIMEEIVNGYAPDKLSQEKRISKVLWVAQCILRDEEGKYEEAEFETEKAMDILKAVKTYDAK